MKRHGGIESGLATERRQDRVGPFLLDDRFEHCSGDGLDVCLVCETRVRHNRRRVRIHEDYPHTLFAQHTAGLRAGVVEFSGLANHNRPRSDNEDARDV